MCRHWAAATLGVQAMGFSSAGIGVFWVVAMGFSSVGIGVFVVAAMMFLCVAVSGLAELSAQAPVVFFREKPGATQKKTGGKVDAPWPNAYISQCKTYKLFPC